MPDRPVSHRCSAKCALGALHVHPRSIRSSAPLLQGAAVELSSDQSWTCGSPAESARTRIPGKLLDRRCRRSVRHRWQADEEAWRPRRAVVLDSLNIEYPCRTVPRSVGQLVGEDALKNGLWKVFCPRLGMGRLPPSSLRDKLSFLLNVRATRPKVSTCWPLGCFVKACGALSKTCSSAGEKTAKNPFVDQAMLLNRRSVRGYTPPKRA